jgi:hypothetical protein
VAKFTDGKGRDWRLELDVSMLPRLRTDASFELGEAAAAGDRFGELLFGRPETVARVLWVLVEADAVAVGVTPEHFAAGLNGPALGRAAAAFMEAVLDFFHPGRAEPMKARLPRIMTKLNTDVGAAMGRAADSILSDSAGSSPGSSGSTPGP